MNAPDSGANDCVFCTRIDQPAILFETPSLSVMPDKYPMLTGHTLIISKAHRRCYGAAPLDLLTELDDVAARVRRFIGDAYGTPALTWENGVVGQTVFHAHLHLIPCRIHSLPEDVKRHPDVVEIDGWENVRRHFARHGHYRYVELGGERWIVGGFSPVINMVRRIMAEATGLEWGPRGWSKTTTPDDVLDVHRRWAEWKASQAGESTVGG